MAKNWYPVIDKNVCIKCGACVSKCANGVYDKGSPETPLVASTEGCIDKCHGCGNLCPVGAITYVGDDTDWVPPNLQTSEDCGCGCDGDCADGSCC